MPPHPLSRPRSFGSKLNVVHEKKMTFLSNIAAMTPYARKRRCLREHRVQMRVMEDIVDEVGLIEEYHAEVMVELDNAPYWLGFDDAPGGMDEESDGEDPEVALRRENEQLRREAVDQQAFIAAVQDLRAHEAMRLELERAHMQLEDRR